MFIFFQGGKDRYRSVLGTNGEPYNESLLNCLPARSFVMTRKEVAGVDKEHFVRWAEQFVLDVKQQTGNNRKVLLTYDGYRSHMSIEALEILEEGGVIAYALPAHTSGTTQPLDVGVFSPFKSAYREELRLVTSAAEERKLDEFDFARILTAAYQKSFAYHNIINAFRKAGLNPHDEMKLIGKARPMSDDEPHRIADVDMMCDMLDAKRKLQSTKLLSPSRVLKSGFIDTSRGVTLTRSTAMDIIKSNESDKHQKRLLEERKREEKRDAERGEADRRRVERCRHSSKALAIRVHMYKEPAVFPRSFYVLCLIAKRHARDNRENGSVFQANVAARQRISTTVPWQDLMSVDQFAMEEEARSPCDAFAVA